MPAERGRPFLGAIFGLFFGLFLAVDLLLMGAIPLDNALVVLLPVIGLIGGIAIGLFAPFRFLKR